MHTLSLEERVLICVESAHDAARIVALLGEIKIEGTTCTDHSEVCEQIARGAAAVILSDAPDTSDSNSRLLLTLNAQPTWSVLPLIIIANESAHSDQLPIGTAFLQRPVQIRSLISIIRSALLARCNQYKVRELLNEREDLVNRLRHEAKVKNEFLATLAHELRNPLAPIRTGLRILRLSPAETPRVQTLEMMERQVCHLVRLIDDLLDISRITLGKLELQRQLVPLAEVLSSAVEASKPLLDAGKHTFSMSVPHELITLEADPIRLAQVITNLLNNAAKYTPNGGTITLTARHTQNILQIEVSDNGIGLAPEMLRKVFDMFAQDKRAMAGSQGGLGIGLTLARRLTELHNGTVEVSSPGPGKGSTFTVTLPCVKNMQSNTVERNASQVFHGKSHRVLIVDDQPDIAQSLKDLLCLLGQDTHTAYNGPDALQAAKDFKPELVFLDIGLPGMTGYEVARNLRANEEIPRPILIAVTGWGDAQNIALAMEAGFDRHLTKPVDPREIERILEAL